ncbi:hypothetical protein KVR01_000454 [Diaporthe batatas]|uniref:uncharacterized protein n=1 Tax=Diaporthe batatas TaxID=748121 RepID=UPI001D037B39|nr:uncharacterized protein KVR01_000454 [Diaporthe batatas]KAG8169709.1 hypothetical protein KVR01_000454 [Diaporthe batatas]
MSAPNKIAEFPDVEAKLQKPTKQSAFERQKAEAEAKRLREAAETAAVYEDFVKSFDADDDHDDRTQNERGPGAFGRPPQPRGGGFGGAGGGRRHFGAPPGAGGIKVSGPGSLGPAPPPMSFGKKRTYDGLQSNNDRRRDHSATGAGRFGSGFDDGEPGSKPIAKAFDASDDEEEHTGLGRSEEKAVARPTLRLANLPPATSPAAIRALIPTNLAVEGVKILPHNTPGVAGTDRKSIAAIVTLSQETAASEIDAAVSALQNRYLGLGYYLSLHRHLSSAAIAAGSMTNLAYEYTTAVDGFVSESEYDSEFDDEDDEEPKITTEGAKEPDEVFLNPIEKAKLVHLLSRLPTTLSKIRKGDIARVTAFAIMHANRGADEIVDLILTNLENPLSFSSANPDQQGDNHHRSRDTSPTPNKDAAPDPAAAASRDTSGSKLVALYVISDILSSSSTSGVRHAWRYRQLLEAALKARRSFEGLGRLPERLSWGRLRAEKWRRSIGLVLGLWEGWCVFPNDSQELFVRSFESPPGLRGEGEGQGEGEGPKAEVARGAGGGRWKTVDATASAAAAAAETPAAEDDAGGSDGSYDEYTDDEEADNELLARYHIDGEPLLEVDIEGLALDGGGEDVRMGGGDGASSSSSAPGVKHEQQGQEDPGGASKAAAAAAAAAASGPGGKRKRVTAADMFADSDSDGK